MVFLYFNVFAAGARITSEKRREVLVKSLKDCKIRENGTENDLKQLMLSDYPDTNQGKCMVACVLEDFAIVSKNLKLWIIWNGIPWVFWQYTEGKFSRDTFIYLAKVAISRDEKVVKFAEDLANKCGSFEGERCDQAFKFVECIHNNLKANFDIQIL